jgi:ankyrin repeat protein
MLLQKSDGSTPLHFALSNRHEAIAKLLLHKGANPSVRDGDGETPLYLAERTGHKTIANLLREMLSS